MDELFGFLVIGGGALGVLTVPLGTVLFNSFARRQQNQYGPSENTKRVIMLVLPFASVLAMYALIVLSGQAGLSVESLGLAMTAASAATVGQRAAYTAWKIIIDPPPRSAQRAPGAPPPYNAQGASTPAGAPHARTLIESMQAPLYAPARAMETRYGRVRLTQFVFLDETTAADAEPAQTFTAQAQARAEQP